VARKPTTEETLMITPEFASSMLGRTAWTAIARPVTLVSMSRRMASSGMSWKRPRQPTPALLTSTSTRSKSRRAPATKARTSAGLVMSVRRTTTASAPA